MYYLNDYKIARKLNNIKGLGHVKEITTLKRIV